MCPVYSVVEFMITTIPCNYFLNPKYLFRLKNEKYRMTILSWMEHQRFCFHILRKVSHVSKIKPSSNFYNPSFVAENVARIQRNNTPTQFFKNLNWITSLEWFGNWDLPASVTPQLLLLHDIIHGSSYDKLSSKNPQENVLLSHKASQNSLWIIGKHDRF